MRRYQKILLGTLCAGVLLGGIGTGISLVEFSSLEYAGERIVGEVRMETKTLENRWPSISPMTVGPCSSQNPPGILTATAIPLQPVASMNVPM